jgi:hypothetical protein
MARPQSGNIVRWLGAAVVVALVGVPVWFDIASGRGYAAWVAPQPILSVATLIAGLIVLSWQLGRQHQNTLEANRRATQDRLRLDVYKEIGDRITATTAPVGRLGFLPTAFVGELIVRRNFGAASGYRFARFQAASQRASASVIALVAVLEVYEIALPEFKVFRKALADANRQVGVAVGDFLSVAGPFFEPHRWPPSEAESAEMARLAELVQGAGINVHGVVWDLRVSAQNRLLGLFPGQPVPDRTPGDPTVRVVRVPDE